MCVCVPRVCAVAPEGQKRLLGHLELGLLVVVSHHVGVGTLTQVI